MKLNTKGESSDVPSGRAISIQQPFVEEILQGKKKFEYRSRQTHIRGRVYLYASLKTREDGNWSKLKLSPEDVPKGLIVGSVEIVDCVWIEKLKAYGYKLANPRRYKEHLKPKNQPQPCFFFPFGVVRSPRKDPKDIKKRTPFRGKVVPSKELAAIVGAEPATRSDFVEKLLKYINKHKLRTSYSRYVIRPDRKLKKLSQKSPFHVTDLEYFVEKNTKRG